MKVTVKHAVGATVAVGTLLFAVCCETLLVDLLGPPSVVLREEYGPVLPTVRVDHSLLDAVLHSHVGDDGSVDYQSLRRQPKRLTAYLALLARLDFDALGRDEKLAVLINAYNAFTLQLILDHPGVESIRDIPSGQRWDAVRWQLGTMTLSLTQIENNYLRARFREPRIHFAINCASRSCPPLRPAAYAGAEIDAQLEQQARFVHSDARWLRLDGTTLHLTRLYQWYASDFEQVAGSTVEHAGRYAPDLAAALADERQPSVEWLDYDWSLNSGL